MFNFNEYVQNFNMKNMTKDFQGNFANFNGEKITDYARQFVENFSSVIKNTTEQLHQSYNQSIDAVKKYNEQMLNDLENLSKSKNQEEFIQMQQKIIQDSFSNSSEFMKTIAENSSKIYAKNLECCNNYFNAENNKDIKHECKNEGHKNENHHSAKK